MGRWLGDIESDSQRVPVIVLQGGALRRLVPSLKVKYTGAEL